MQVFLIHENIESLQKVLISIKFTIFPPVLLVKTVMH
jgi:hypothetical protein